MPADPPAWAPSPREIADVELVLDGALPPGVSVAVGGDRPDDVKPGTAVVLTDDEGAPVAELTVVDRWTDGPRDRARDVVTGDLLRLAEPAHGVARAHRRRPDQVRARLDDGRPVLAVVAFRPLLTADLAVITQRATAAGARPLVLVAVGDVVGPIPPATTTRAVLAALPLLPADTVFAAVAVSEPDQAPPVATAYGATEVVVVAADPASDAVLDHLDAGTAIPATLAPEPVAAVLRRDRPPRSRRGLTVFCTGLSGSGKSTVARALAEALTEDGERTVSLLDGDVVRRLLSAGLTFSRTDRDRNITRIGFVAAEVTRHGGIAICAPIAPYAATRARVRDMVQAVGDFLLVHISTPLAVCEQRDRKGLYAKARAGLIPQFTGISDPYEEPTDADIVLDTSLVSLPDAVTIVLDTLRSGGWLTGAENDR